MATVGLQTTCEEVLFRDPVFFLGILQEHKYLPNAEKHPKLSWMKPQTK